MSETTEAFIRSQAKLSESQCDELRLSSVLNLKKTEDVRGKLWSHFVEQFIRAKRTQESPSVRLVLKYPDDLVVVPQQILEDGLLESLLTVRQSSKNRGTNPMSLQMVDRTAADIVIPVARGVVRGETVIAHELSHARKVHEAIGAPVYAVIPFLWVQHGAALRFECQGGVVKTELVKKALSATTPEQQLDMALAPLFPSEKDFADAERFARLRGEKAVEYYQTLRASKPATAGEFGVLQPVTSERADMMVHEIWKTRVQLDALGLAGFRGAAPLTPKT